ncbi:ketosteroid isomerase-like protein [Flavobacteriaceae bacterium MAR_2010_72]|nr:ketosteroid isomerase-like protein [Flavobacteriaceae bacterium MAR_2010_72]TVZ59974.1 ketosteroid isomerase-like protein [Flavobacteriaceae bacterium MAR_2010_105]
MKKPLFQSIALLLTLAACAPKGDDLKEQWKEELLEAETQFAALVKEKGLHEAFVAFADENAVLMRNNTLIIGKKAIDERYRNMNSKTLTWTPDFIDVSKSGDLGYTYGTYQFKYTDSTGTDRIDTGIFHSVWKRQDDGSWKYVWD